MATAKINFSDPVITLTLNLKEAQLIRDVIGSISGTEPEQTSIFMALDGLNPHITATTVMLVPREYSTQPNFVIKPYKRG
jgi:hypothetical protein